MARKFFIERVVIGATTIGGVISQSIDPEIESVLDSGSSELDPSRHSIEQVFGLITFSTLDVGVCLGLLSSTTIPHKRITAGTVATVYLQAASDGGTRGGAGTNISLEINAGTLIVTGIAGTGRRAVANVTIACSFDGANLPIVRTTSDDLPAGQPGAAKVWRAHGVKDDTTTLARITDWSVDFGIRFDRVALKALIYSPELELVTFAPRGTFATNDLASALALSGIQGAQCGAAGLKFFIAEYDDDGVGVLTTGAYALTFRAGSIYWPTGFTLAQGITSIAYNVLGIGGTNAQPPLTIATGQTVPSETTSSGLFRAGPIKRDATEIEYASAAVDFGIDWVPIMPAALYWPNAADLIDRRLSVRVTTHDVESLLSLGNGTPIITGLHLYARRQTGDGDPVADGTASHVKLSLNAGMLVPGAVRGEHRGIVTGEFAVTAVKASGGSDGSQITLSTASAIA